MSTLSDLIYEKSKDLIDEAYDKGRNAGGYTDGFDAGKQAEYDAFWDAYQDSGLRTSYLGAYSGSGWSDKTFDPKYPMYVTDATYMFFHFSKTKQFNLYQYCVDNNKILDFTNCTAFVSTFSYSAITHIGTINMTSCTEASAYSTSNMFTGCAALQSIEEIVSKEGIAWNSGAFTNCSALKFISFSGVIGTSISFAQSSLLEVSSMDSIYAALKDYTSNPGAYTLTLHATAWARWDAAKPDLVDQYGTMKNYVTATKGWATS